MFGEVVSLSIKNLKWCHTYPELDIKGTEPIKHQEFITSIIPEDLTGKTVLDLGAWDGYYGHIASRRNAKTVVVLDSGEAEQRTFKQTVSDMFIKINHINKKLNTNLHFIPMNVSDIDKLQMEFDVIFCFGLFYHVKNPYDLFEKCYQKSNEMFLLEGHVSDALEESAYILNKAELNNDPSNYWVMSKSCIIKMLKRIGFKEVRFIKQMGNRGLFIAKK